MFPSDSHHHYYWLLIVNSNLRHPSLFEILFLYCILINYRFLPHHLMMYYPPCLNYCFWLYWICWSIHHYFLWHLLLPFKCSPPPNKHRPNDSCCTTQFTTEYSPFIYFSHSDSHHIYTLTPWAWNPNLNECLLSWHSSIALLFRHLSARSLTANNSDSSSSNSTGPNTPLAYLYLLFQKLILQERVLSLLVTWPTPYFWCSPYIPFDSSYSLWHIPWFPCFGHPVA